jgi:hypothetical protein
MLSAFLFLPTQRFMEDSSMMTTLMDPEDSLASIPLPRGEVTSVDQRCPPPSPADFPTQACLPCRRRKSVSGPSISGHFFYYNPESTQKCDGTKPICRQCARGKRANDCRYDPSKAWSTFDADYAFPPCPSKPLYQVVIVNCNTGLCRWSDA